jgi:hypothetical protein
LIRNILIPRNPVVNDPHLGSVQLEAANEAIRKLTLEETVSLIGRKVQRNV